MGTQAPSMTLSSSPLELQSWAELGGTWRLVACSPRTRLRQVTPGDLSSGADVVTRGLCNLGQLCKTGPLQFYTCLLYTSDAADEERLV